MSRGRGPEQSEVSPLQRPAPALSVVPSSPLPPAPSHSLLLPPDALRVRKDHPRLVSPPAKMLWLLWCPVLLGRVTAGPDSDGPQLQPRAGQDVTLECRARAPPGPDLHHLRVHWHLLREPAGGSVVHSYYAGADQLGDQAEEFRGRTRLLLQGIRQGVAALTLASVRPSDSGTYRCYIMDSQGDSTMDIVLRVAAPEAQMPAPEQRFPGWAMAVVTLALVTLVCAVLIHWGLPLIPAEGLPVGWRRAPGSQDSLPVRTDSPEVEMAEH
ncbi:E3 ubiquitin-protein ligase HECTD3 [Platysternon megacephalum]|uniref:E3 ubiquitin-protein ligase HECTD3 n=1 Tax=Platysternon megacephalum TaxID=55544 RepID=A0A4D9DGR7_9SAUR|nr:E3 ubiquitin-protein ligase HECTD3 [Platysternon megacephalum]